MKLYLSSYRIPHLESLLQLAGMPASEIKMAIIPNAKDYYAVRARNFKLRQTEEYMSAIGIRSETVDLKEYDDPAALRGKLSAFNMIWVSGGNTFCLRYEMKRSGFEKIIRQLLEDGIVYCGESAGTCVAGFSLKGLEKEDEPEFAESIFWDGLGWVDRFILPHADNPAFSDDAEYTRGLYKNDGRYIEIDDNQVLIIDGDTEKIVTGSQL